MTSPTPLAPAGAEPRWTGNLLERLSDGPLAGAGRLALDGGRVVGHVAHGRIASAFQPVVRASDGSTVGHQAYARVTSPDGEPVAPWAVFAHTTDGREVVRLDRLVRTVHALNALDRPRRGQRLFVRVEQRLLDTVADDYGHAFEDILAIAGAKPSQVAIVLPASALDDPPVFVRAALAYRSRGYEVAVQLRSTRDLARSSLAIAHPAYVMLDRPAAEQVPGAGRVVAALHEIGARVIARHVENAAEAAYATAAGFDLLQGYHVGRPGDRPENAQREAR